MKKIKTPFLVGLQGPLISYWRFTDERWFDTIGVIPYIIIIKEWKE